MAEILAHAGHMGSEVMNCSAPDTGNMGACLSPYALGESIIITVLQRCWLGMVMKHNRSSG